MTTTTGARAERPGLDEHDVWSYLDGTLMEHNVRHVLADGTIDVVPAPAFRTEQIFTSGPLCRCCSYALAQSNGYGQPETMSVTYTGGTSDDEEVLVIRGEAGFPVTIAAYAYGRACFDPGEPRTTPCTNCGTETLIDTEAAS